ncbi:hypothetical protein [Enterococcus faecium]|uniref:hypothetical protein n=1 Tax=Enterococcus faecium TaxID=1352 RepID=UPI001E5C98C5|nr:hypothetical protein [Enterococcus faecium]MCE3183549.1 hypothetical protein [Enterococcus faecium]MCW8790385.1 hypothetical protein [Enterococcus faecium]MCW8792893.1 hypothetical protein [Enterococcus faecium]MCW8795385.1 hypothetical protein [Enterococcus faecium]MDW3607858.1 hypothetical protein [Enterococcus faecium]
MFFRILKLTSTTGIKYIHQFSVLVLGTLIIVGIVAFIIQGRDILTVHQEFFSYAFGIPLIAIRSDNKKWKKRYYILLLFLCFYLPPKIFTLLGIQCLSFSFISYIIVLIFLSFIVWVFYLVKK